MNPTGSAPLLPFDSEAQQYTINASPNKDFIINKQNPSNQTIKTSYQRLDADQPPNKNLNECSFGEAMFPGFTWKSFVFWVTILQVLLTAITTFVEKRLTTTENKQIIGTCVAYEFGAFFTPSVVNNHHFHRFFIPIFLHQGWEHCIGNMLIQILYGFEQERIFGTKKFIFIYMLTGIGGNLFAGIFMPIGVMVGASTSLYGMGGVQMCYLKERWSEINRGRKVVIIIVSVIMFNGFSAMLNPKSHVGHWAHLGGLLIGFYVGFLFLHNSVFIQRFSVGLLALYFVVCLVVLYLLPENEDFAIYISTLCDNIVNKHKK